MLQTVRQLSGLAAPVAGPRDACAETGVCHRSGPSWLNVARLDSAFTSQATEVTGHCTEARAPKITVVWFVYYQVVTGPLQSLNHRREAKEKTSPAFRGYVLRAFDTWSQSKKITHSPM